MKKTLERLRREMIEDIDRYLKAREELDKASTKAKMIKFVFRANDVIVSSISYIQHLKMPIQNLPNHSIRSLKRWKKP